MTPFESNSFNFGLTLSLFSQSNHLLIILTWMLDKRPEDLVSHHQRHRSYQFAQRWHGVKGPVLKGIANYYRRPREAVLSSSSQVTPLLFPPPVLPPLLLLPPPIPPFFSLPSPLYEEFFLLVLWARSLHESYIISQTVLRPATIFRDCCPPDQAELGLARPWTNHLLWKTGCPAMTLLGWTTIGPQDLSLLALWSSHVIFSTVYQRQHHHRSETGAPIRSVYLSPFSFRFVVGYC